MVSETYKRVTQLIKSLHRGKHINAMTEKWLSLTQNPPGIPVFYTLTKIHKPNPVGRPIISGCEGPTERISSFVENIKQFKRKLRARGYPGNLSEKILSEFKFSERPSALQNKQKTHKRILPFVTEYRPSVPNLKNILMAKWHLIQNQPVLREIFKDPPILSYRKGRSLKDNSSEPNFEGQR